MSLPASLGLAAVLVAGCGLATDKALPSGTVQLLNSSQGTVGCPSNVIEGDLVVDASAGTAISATDYRRPIKWPYGYSGRAQGSVIEIVGPTGQVVARTGTKIRLGGGEAEQGIWVACPNPQTLP